MRLSDKMMRHVRAVDDERPDLNPIEKAEEVIRRADSDAGMAFDSAALTEEEYAELLEDIMLAEREGAR
jgi:hypothetical protein